MGDEAAWEKRMKGEQNPETAVEQHEVIYRGKIIDLEVDSVRLPSGRAVIREVVKHPGGVVVVPVLEGGKLLIIRQFRYPLKKYILEFPAGKLDSGQSPLDTARRELEEETGFEAASLHHEFSFYTSPGICDEVIHLFMAAGLTQAEQRLEEGEHITVESHTLEECLRMITSGEIADAKTIMGILWYQHQTSS